MAKRDSGGTRSKAAATTSAPSEGAMTGAMEQQVVAFAEQLGRIVGTVQAKTEGWTDRDALNKQIAGVRDSAVELLEQLKTTVTKATNRAKAAKKTAGGAAAKSRGRSGGVVDAPGKKHRRPAPNDPRAIAADAKSSQMRSARPMAKTMRQRSRG